MRKKYIITVIFVGIIILLFFSLPWIINSAKRANFGMSRGGPACSVEAGEWVPARGECPGQTQDIRTRCDEFCAKHPDCCGQSAPGEQAFGGREVPLALPSNKEIKGLKRIYPAAIKALNEGPNIYPREGQAQIISDEKLSAIKAVGFNTIQLYFIGKKENGRLVFNNFSNSILLNDIVAIKKQGLAVWVALDVAGVPTSSSQGSLGNYNDFKKSFLAFTKDAAELMEKYQVEYFTPNNEPDKPFKEQKNWSAAEINANLADFLPATNAAAREKFNGKLINKITQSDKHTAAVLAASFKNVDIAGIDVGPPMDGKMSFADYQAKFKEYQTYATQAEQAGVAWMNAEYWQGDFDQGYFDFAQQNEVKYAKVSFDAYLKVEPRGKGYAWNDWATFSLPQGEQMKKEIKEFFAKF